MSGTLLKKALRDIRGHLGAYLACAMLMAIGVLFYGAMTQVAGNLPISLEKFYREYRFGDVFGEVNSLPASRLQRLEGIDGVRAASGRLVTTARVVHDGGQKTVELKLHSYDPAEADRLNDVYITLGAPPVAGGYELLVTENFFKANGLSLGDTLDIAIRGKRVTFAVVGAVQTPEYVYITPEGSFMPDDKNYGIAYLPLDILEAQLGRAGEVNDISLLLEPGRSYASVERALQDALSPGGLIRLYARKDQASNSMLELELTSIGMMVGVVPVIFLLLGALIMSVVIKRMVEQQHAQIGLLKAFGYSQRDVLLHFSCYGLVIGLMASIIGGVLGALTAQYIAAMFAQFFVMPGISGEYSLENVLKLSLLALFFGVAASIYGARGVLRLRAAEAMRPPAPPSGKPILLERWRRLWRKLGTTLQMSMRNLFRARSRSLMTFFGLAVCYALTAAVFAFSPMIDFMMHDNYLAVQQYDYKLNLVQMAGARPLEQSLLRMQGVAQAEAVVELPCTLRAGAISKDVTLLALAGDAQLYRLFDEEDNPVPLPEEGLVLTRRMAEDLGVGVGDALLLDVPYPDQEARAVVAALCEQYASNYAVANRAYIARLLHTGQIATGAMFKLQPGVADSARERMVERLSQAENVASVADVMQMLTSMNELMQASMSMLYAMAVMAVFAGFAIVYNAGVVILSERTRELASMRVLGFSLNETVWVVAAEQLVLLAAGMLVGLPLTGATLESLAAAIASDLFAIPTRVPVSSHLTSVFCMLLAWVAALFVTRRKVARTAMADVLKERD